MSKGLKIAAIVVGVAAIVLTGGIALGLIAPGIIAGLGITATALASVLTVTASALSVAAGIMAKKPSFASVSAGQQLEWMADPSAGQPYVMGDARVGEAIIHQASWGDKNKYLGIAGVLSCAGPIMAYDGFYADNTLIAFSSNNAVGYYNDWMYHNAKTGTRPSDPLPMHSMLPTPMPDWGANHKLSSLAASGLILVADTEEGKIYSGGTPKFTHQIRGVRCYDARFDSSNGGAGVQRPGGATSAETQYEYSANPWVHHGTYALGRWVEGIKVIGPGLPKESIDWPSHIEAANIADANGWTISGRIMSTDRKWEALKAIAQAGGGYPVPSGTKLMCLVNTPRVSLETIEEEHLKGPVSAPQMSMRRERLNGAIARFRSPDHAWEIVSSDPVRNATWLADDGAPRTKEIDLPLVADKDQAAQLVAYEVANSRERSPISVELDLYWSQYKVGDCLTLNIPSALLVNQKAVIIGRELDASSNTVRFEFQTETHSKHAWALGVTGTAPPPTTVGSDPGAGDTGGDPTTDELIQLIKLSSSPDLRFSVATNGDVTINTHNRSYDDIGSVSVTGTPGTASDGTGGTPIATGAAVGQYISMYYDDLDRSGGAVTYAYIITAAGADNSAAFASLANPGRHNVFVRQAPATGSSGGGSAPGTGGGTTGPGGPGTSLE